MSMLLTSDRKVKHESKVGVVPDRHGEEGVESEGKAFASTLTCGHKLWVVTERMRSRI